MKPSEPRFTPKIGVGRAPRIDAACSSGCKVKLENGDEYELKGGETVSIEDGVLFVDHSPDADVKDIPDIDPDAPPPEESAE